MRNGLIGLLIGVLGCAAATQPTPAPRIAAPAPDSDPDPDPDSDPDSDPDPDPDPDSDSDSDSDSDPDSDSDSDPDPDSDSDPAPPATFADSLARLTPVASTPDSPPPTPAITELWLYTDPGYHDDDSEGLTPDPRPHRGPPVITRFCGPAAATQAARLLADVDSDPICSTPTACSFFAPSDRVGAETRFIARGPDRWVVAQLAPGGPRPRVERAFAAFLRRARPCPRP